VRQIVLDTETTGLELSAGHRVIEIGCIELLHRRPSGRSWHRYIRPGREVDAAALAVHGITNEFLAAQPSFPEVAEEFLAFIDGAELVIHNAEFDVSFLDAELGAAGIERPVAERCRVCDTLAMARRMHPGQRNSLDALCKRYNVDNSGRDLHGALKDARILADVYLAMSGGQAALGLEAAPAEAAATAVSPAARGAVRIPVVRAGAAELAAHERSLDAIDRASNGRTIFRAGSARGA
jgi:DNA polymerase-3 subunit epsilon